MTEKELKIVLIKDEHGVIDNIKLTCECTIMDMLIGAVVLMEKVSECAKEEDMSLAEILVKHIQAKKLADLVLAISKQTSAEETSNDTDQTE